MGRNTNKERGRRPNDAQPWRRLMTEDRGKQPTPQTPLVPADNEPPQQWKWVDERTVAVRISPYLQFTLAGLARAIQKIPYRERLGIVSYQWAGVYTEAGQRWGRIRVELAKG